MEESCKVPGWHFQEFNLFFVNAGAKKLTNKAALWYVPCCLQNVEKIMEVPPIKVHGTKVTLTFIDLSLAFHSLAFLLLYLTLALHMNQKWQKIHERGHLVKIKNTSVKIWSLALLILHAETRYLCTCSCCVCCACSMPVRSKRKRAESAMRRRRWRDWRPKQGLTTSYQLLPTQVIILV